MGAQDGDRASLGNHGNVEAPVKGGVTDEHHAKVLTTITTHVQIIETLREKVA